MGIIDDIISDELEEMEAFGRRRNRILSAADDVAGCYNALIGFEDTVPAKLRRALDRLNDAMA